MLPIKSDKNGTVFLVSPPALAEARWREWYLFTSRISYSLKPLISSQLNYTNLYFLAIQAMTADRHL